ncbi:putative nucleotidyltransferase with HDIG domain [Paenibacillus sp. DS2015]|uniref:HD domain-containing phosphohydrolase n=1 Tax=Paenibacillus sp. DS2015 TaxID=3373917 RepID=UPI003D1BCC39
MNINGYDEGRIISAGRERLYRSFLRKLLFNYMGGSIIAVMVLGSLVMLTTLDISPIEDKRLILILLISLVVMMIVELKVFFRHIGPIRSGLLNRSMDISVMEEAYVQAHRLPKLSVYRILGPHLLGLAVPAILLTSWMVHEKLLDVPYYYILLAILGAISVASMHAMVEFFLTTVAIRPIIIELSRQGIDRGVDFTSEGHSFSSIRFKFLFSSMLIGISPLLLFSIAAQIRLGNMNNDVVKDYWAWAGFILLISIGFSYLGARLITQDVQRPLGQLYDAMDEVRSGRLVEIPNSYSDEFSRLVAGFNMMIRGLEEREKKNRDMLDSYFSTLAAALDARDAYTAGHSIRVTEYAVLIGNLAGMSNEDVGIIRRSALLHDIGKIGISDGVLLKEGQLTKDEFDHIKTHTTMGVNILEQIQPKEAIIPYLSGVRSHHERFDGKGYPDGLVAEEIPRVGRIIAVADAYDAMTSDRPYRRGMGYKQALSILEEGRGTQWDPTYAQLFVDYMREKEQL